MRRSGQRRARSPDARKRRASRAMVVRVARRPRRAACGLSADAGRAGGRRSRRQKSSADDDLAWRRARPERRRHDAAVGPRPVQAVAPPEPKPRVEPPPAAKTPEMTMPDPARLKPKAAAESSTKPVGQVGERASRRRAPEVKRGDARADTGRRRFRSAGCRPAGAAPAVSARRRRLLLPRVPRTR